MCWMFLGYCFCVMLGFALMMTRVFVIMKTLEKNMTLMMMVHMALVVALGFPPS
jgi:hypothetical protein